jgi:hypothetical protein
MFARVFAVLASLTLAGCGSYAPPPDTARLPPGMFGEPDNDVGAANLSSWAFADPARTRNDPATAARACAALDYIAGEYSSNPRYVAKSPLTKQELLQGREAMRHVLGIPPGVPSQVVTTALLQFAAAWQAGDQHAALRALAAPGFALPPQQTLQILISLPFIHTANVATLHVAEQILNGPM